MYLTALFFRQLNQFYSKSEELLSEKIVTAKNVNVNADNSLKSLQQSINRTFVKNIDS